jgi:hypothetical protein
VCASTDVLARSRMVGRGRYLVNGPAPIAGACAARVRRRSGDLPGLRCTRAPGRWDPAVIGPTLTAAAGQETTAPPARHSTRVRSAMSPGCEVVPRARGALAGVVALPRVRRSKRAAEKILVWPVTRRHLGSGARTLTGSPATWRLLTPRGCGGNPRIAAKPPALWS